MIKFTRTGKRLALARLFFSFSIGTSANTSARAARQVHAPRLPHAFIRCNAQTNRSDCPVHPNIFGISTAAVAPHTALSANTPPDGPHASGPMSRDPFYQGIPGIFSHFL
ncbi:hypothetical protein [Burkholderia stagnalis]|uniref:hypothetical protein n=1 Tax=Burkholderia stagnalis TaxID=1503054 RepID=UPI000A55B176|nr:hypothetical protein [Burkholderia stagnalis]